MAVPVTVPRLGWSMDEGTFVEWLKHDGDPVRPGEALFVGDGGMLLADYGRRLLLPEDKFKGFEAPKPRPACPIRATPKSTPTSGKPPSQHTIRPRPARWGLAPMPCWTHGCGCEASSACAWSMRPQCRTSSPVTSTLRF